MDTWHNLNGSARERNEVDDERAEFPGGISMESAAKPALGPRASRTRSRTLGFDGKKKRTRSNEQTTNLEPITTTTKTEQDGELSFVG